MPTTKPNGEPNSTLSGNAPFTTRFIMDPANSTAQNDNSRCDGFVNKRQGEKAANEKPFAMSN